MIMCSIWVERPTRPPEYMVWFSRLCYILALPSMSLRECLFLYQSMGGSLEKKLFDLAMVVAVLGTTSSLRFL